LSASGWRTAKKPGKPAITLKPVYFCTLYTMSIHINGLSKTYGTQRALNAISFSVEEGGIVGFLGPNGAGKSTTFKIITGYVPPTEGSVLVNGLSVTEQAHEVKKIIGYLPEHNPLYLDMFVHEYLHFIGKLYGLRGALLKARVGEMVERCGLTLEQNKKIEALSKGYRQRIGLAQALLHDPKVLILDEPTSGLDPNQLVEIRKLIKEVSRNKTVIFSTHIMQEVEALCERVVIINKGEMVADDSLRALMKGQQQVAYIAEFDGAVSLEMISNMEGVAEVVALSATTTSSKFRIVPAHEADIRATLFRMAADRQLLLVGLRQEERNLENLFQQLTNPANP
jgi:ABC-2 type transport system ATP-binding protein